MVGVVVLGGFIFLGWMMIQFGGNLVSPFAADTIPVRFIADRADGLSNGSAILYRGVNVGRVENVIRAEDQLRVYIDAAMDAEPPLPSNFRAVIRSTGLVGSGSALVLVLTEPEPRGTLEAGQSIETTFVGLDIIPTEVNELVAELRLAVKQFRESNLVLHVDQQVEKAGRLVDSIQSIVNDPKLQQDLRASLANIRAATERANKIADNLDQATAKLDKLTGETSDAVTSISKQATDRLQQVSKLLDQFHAIAEKVNTGNGTAGALVNDPKLYQNLVETAAELNGTVKDLRRLLQQWEQEGVNLKLQ